MLLTAAAASRRIEPLFRIPPQEEDGEKGLAEVVGRRRRRRFVEAVDVSFASPS